MAAYLIKWITKHQQEHTIKDVSEEKVPIVVNAIEDSDGIVTQITTMI